MQLFSVDASVFKKRKKIDHKNMKKQPSKVAHNHNLFYVLAQLPKRPRNRNPITPKAPLCRTILSFTTFSAVKAAG